MPHAHPRVCQTVLWHPAHSTLSRFCYSELLLLQLCQVLPFIQMPRVCPPYSSKDMLLQTILLVVLVLGCLFPCSPFLGRGSGITAALLILDPWPQVVSLEGVGIVL